MRRALSLARRGRGAGQSGSPGRCGGRTRRPGDRRRGVPQPGRTPRRGRSPRRGRRALPERHPLRNPGAVRPSRNHPTLRRGRGCRGNQPRRLRPGRSRRTGEGTRVRPPPRCGHRRRGGAPRRRCRTGQRRFPDPPPDRKAVDRPQAGAEPRRAHCHQNRRLAVDHRKARPPPRPSLAFLGRRRRRGGGGPFFPTIPSLRSATCGAATPARWWSTEDSGFRPGPPSFGGGPGCLSPRTPFRRGAAASSRPQVPRSGLSRPNPAASTSAFWSAPPGSAA